MSTEQKEKEELLQQLYYDPKKGLTHAEKLYQKVRDKGIKLKEVKDFVSKEQLGQRYCQPTMKDHCASILLSSRFDILSQDKTNQQRV